MVQILVSWLLALEATEPVYEPVTQMTVELTNIQYCLLSMDRAEKSYTIYIQSKLVLPVNKIIEILIEYKCMIHQNYDATHSSCSFLPKIKLQS